MKYISLFILISIFKFSDIQSQESTKTKLFLEYRITYNLGKTLTKKGYVFNFNSKKYFFTGKSFFKEELLRKDSFDISTNTRSINLVSVGDGSESLIADFYKKTIYQKRSIGNDILTVKDYFQEMEWIDTGKNDSIFNYPCKIFKVSFRGRDYLAHVTSKIERDNSLGPWKFNGFSGIPLLIYDTENKLRWEILKVDRMSYQKLEKYANDIENKQKKLKEVSIEYFVNLYDMTNGGMTLARGYPYLGSDFEKQKSKKKFKRKGLELIYEWEK